MHEGTQNLEALSSPHIWFLDHYTRASNHESSGEFAGLVPPSLRVELEGACARALQAVEGSHQLLAGWLRRTTQRWRAWRGSKVGGCKAACSKAAGLIHVPGYCNPQHRCGWRGLPACSVRGWQHRPTLQRPSATTWARPSSSAQHFFFILQVLLLLKSRGTSNITDRKGSFWKSSVMPFSPNSVSTLRGSYGKCKGRCLIRVLTLGASLFPAKFPSEVALVKCWHAFWLRRLAQSAGPASGARHFSCKFPCKVALAKCWSAFRLGKVCVRVLGSFWSVTFYLYISI